MGLEPPFDSVNISMWHGLVCHVGLQGRIVGSVRNADSSDPADERGFIVADEDKVYHASTLRIEGSKVVLSIPVVAGQLKSAIDDIRDVVPLINALLRYEGVFRGLDDSTRAARFPGIAAQHMIYQSRLLDTISAASLLVDIASGLEDIADHGFPEFGCDRSFDV